MKKNCALSWLFTKIIIWTY